ncbi:hypothetical protein [Cryobacterium tepidiphilum]|uniref:Di-and tripeptidase n=1 Tax=Cryobacterium tepidiphilum TaxID=2486026 RepID=A0A3M8L2B8_9MICO|nr:hypothetical protein [Cryobacterium tepidiphilum]RNE59039.1 hypothetical protein EEJ31_11555 [Cryobacterium tepidiphilum]
MARKPTPIVSVTGGTPGGGALPNGLTKGIDTFLAVHRPAVIAHIRGIRKRNPGASPADLIDVLERRYLAAVTTGGAAVGASGVVPGIGTAATLALSGVETAGFLEASALFAQSVSEVHGIAVEDPERARALVMAMMLGHEGSDLVRQLAAQVSGGGVARNAYWGELVANSLPRAIMGPLTDRLKSTFIRQFASRGGASLLGKAIPFGVGAVIGGVGNRIVGRKVVRSSRLAFGEPPREFPPGLEAVIRDVTVREAAGQRVAGAITGAKNAVPRVVPARLRRKNPTRE